jgi:hypothetical protein
MKKNKNKIHLNIKFLILETQMPTTIALYQIYNGYYLRSVKYPYQAFELYDLYEN